MIYPADSIDYLNPAGKRLQQCLYVLCFISLLGGFNVQLMSSPTEKPGNDLSKAEVESAIQLRLVDEEGYQRVLAENQGKIVVVDFWATWCPPCVASFPKLVDMASRYRGKEVIVIAASVDFPGTEEKVKEFLHRQKAYFPQLFVTAENINVFIKSVSPRWDGSVPVIFVYDRDGKIAGQYSGDTAIEHTEEKVRDLLK